MIAQNNPYIVSDTSATATNSDTVAYGGHIHARISSLIFTECSENLL